MLTALTLALTLAWTPAPVAPIAEDTTALVQEEKRSDIAHYNLEKNGLAISGYDPVAYFPEGGSKPKKGSKKLTHTHAGVTYRFATQANLDLFKKTPAKFEPEYGGWCAYAMAGGDKVEIDPESFLIQEGKLHLFYKSFFNNTRKSWKKKPVELRKKANAEWKKCTAKKDKKKQYQAPDPWQ